MKDLSPKDRKQISALLLAMAAVFLGYSLKEADNFQLRTALVAVALFGIGVSYALYFFNAKPLYSPGTRVGRFNQGPWGRDYLTILEVTESQYTCLNSKGHAVFISVDEVDSDYGAIVRA
jgi:hypothetical protein